MESGKHHTPIPIDKVIGRELEIDRQPRNAGPSLPRNAGDDTEREAAAAEIDRENGFAGRVDE